METQKPKLWDIVTIISQGIIGVVVKVNSEGNYYVAEGAYSPVEYAGSMLEVTCSDTLEELLQEDIAVGGQTSFGRGLGEVSLVEGKIELYELKVRRQNERRASLARAIELLEEEGYSVALK